MAESYPAGNLFSHLAETTAKFPDQTALIMGGEEPFQTYTFHELNQGVLHCAYYLGAKGIKKGNKVLLFVKPGYELTVIAFALIFLGAVPVIIDPGMGIRQALACIRSTEPQFLIAIPSVFWASFAFKKSFKSLKGRILVKSRIFSNKTMSQNCSALPHPAETKIDDLAAIVFTSGSTGPPKGVCYLHKNFNAQIKSLKENFDIRRGEVDLATLPIFSLFNPALGVTTVLPEMDPRKPSAANPEKLVQAIQRLRITSAFASPVIGKKITEFCLSKGIRLPEMKRIFIAGAPSPPSLISGLASVLENGTVYIPYGATEALPISFCTASEVKKNLQSVLKGNGSLLGRVISGVTVKIFPSRPSSLSGQLPELGEFKGNQVGEICVSGEIVTDGYFRKPGATFDSRFTYKNLDFHRMGDLGYFDKKGILRFLGRKAECVRTHAGPLETERCEPMINELEGVNKAALVGLGKNSLQEPCMVVELANSSVRKVGRLELRRKILGILKEAFPEYGFRRVIWEKHIPVDARHNAKIHRLALSKKWSKVIEKNQVFGIPE